MVSAPRAAQCVVALTIVDLPAMTIAIVSVVLPVVHIWMVLKVRAVLMVLTVCQCAAAALDHLPGTRVIQHLILKEVVPEHMITHLAVPRVDIPSVNLFVNPADPWRMHPLHPVTADPRQLSLSHPLVTINVRGPLLEADLTTMRPTVSMIGTENPQLHTQMAHHSRVLLNMTITVVTVEAATIFRTAITVTPKEVVITNQLTTVTMMGMEAGQLPHDRLQIIIMADRKAAWDRSNVVSESTVHPYLPKHMPSSHLLPFRTRRQISQCTSNASSARRTTHSRVRFVPTFQPLGSRFIIVCTNKKDREPD